jgi:hypothetical protein
MTAFVGLLSLLGILVGLVSVVVPLRFLKIHNRRAAMMVVAACSATFLAAVALDTPSGGAASGAKAVSAPAQQAIAVPTVDNGCHLAGALPNCEEEVAKLVAANAARAATPDHPAPVQSRQSNRSNPGRDYASEKMNEIKALEASANVKALAARRELDAAQYRLENANSRFDRSVSDLNAVAQRHKLESDSLSYDLRIQEREWERKRRGY